MKNKIKGSTVYIVGAGFYGSVLAERIARNTSLKVEVIEKRDHVGGNSYSFADPETNIEIHKYGSHIFHTSDREVWEYLNEFTEFNQYRHYVYTDFKGKAYSMPINLDTINSFYGESLKPAEARLRVRADIEKSGVQVPKNLEEKAINLVGRPLYEAFVKGYTAKQWGTDPRELPESIINRLPVRYNFNRRYFSDCFEGIPVNGYGSIFKKMLDHPNITVRLGTDFFKFRDKIPKGSLIIYSGPIDRYFNYVYGQLGWRTLDFEVELHEVDDYQGTSVMNYAEAAIPYTRVHEFKHFQQERKTKENNTIIYKEFSRFANIEDDPYYPINTAEDKERYKKYLKLAKNEEGVVFGGRLGTYSYLDMHQVIKSSLATFKRIFG